ncbi:hypothetical protein [Streptomyces sp. DH24]|nr:hypothetical protein [Streptomyces sp. DH24]MDG9719077.1 hypothetical protein [Streptomyces sp. DH24]
MQPSAPPTSDLSAERDRVDRMTADPVRSADTLDEVIDAAPDR